MQECAAIQALLQDHASTTRSPQTIFTTPQSRHSDVVEPFYCIPGCIPYSPAQKLRESIKLGLCSSEWDQTWNEDSQSNALERNGEIFPNTRVLLAKMMMSYMKNRTYKHSAGKSSPLSYYSAIDRVAKIF